MSGNVVMSALMAACCGVSLSSESFGKRLLHREIAVSSQVFVNWASSVDMLLSTSAAEIFETWSL